MNEEARRQQEEVVKGYVDRHARVNRVSHRVLKANEGACAKGEYAPGMVVMSTGDVWRPYREAYQYFVGKDDRPRVLAVAPGSPAENGGVKVGDVLLNINNRGVSDTNDVRDRLREQEKPTLRVERDGALLDLVINQDKVCVSPVGLLEDSNVNAYALGEEIVVLAGLVKFVRSDDELALIVGHELAHNAMKHLDAKRNNSILGTLLLDVPLILLTGVNSGVGRSIGATAYSQEFETEADYVGLYYTAKAGYNVTGVAEFWRRMGVEHPNAIYTATTHPTTANRFVTLEATAAEIAEKRAKGLPLDPQMKSDK